MILQSLFVVFLLVPSAVIAAYYLFWALLRTAGIRDVRRPTEPARNRILILIPAHNEEAILAETLQSCAAVDYPRDLYEVTVIADNCTDKTPEIATQHGVSCWERHDLQQPGKGFALAWAFAQLHDTCATTRFSYSTPTAVSNPIRSACWMLFCSPAAA